MHIPSAGICGMALWWAWFASYFFPRELGVAGGFADEATWARVALMGGLVVGALAHAAALRAGKARKQADRDPQASVEGEAGGGVPVREVACCLAMSACSAAFCLASLGAVGRAALLGGLFVGTVGAGALYLRLFEQAAALGRRGAGQALGCAALLGGLVRLALVGVGAALPVAADAVCALLPWAALAMGHRQAQPGPQGEQASRQAQVTPMFAAYALVFGVLYGFMLVLALQQATGGAGAGAAALEALSAAGLAGAGAAALLAYRRHDEPGYLRLLRVVTVLMAAGMLVLAFLGSRCSTLATALVALGYIFYWLLFNVAWVDMSEREGLSAGSVAAHGLALSALGIAAGTALAGVGGPLWAHDGRALALTCACLCAALMLAGLFMLDTKVFEDMGGMVRPAPPDPAQTDALIARVDDLARTFGLTAREREIALMLARGRNPRAIEERLGISVNTVRTHVHHIYEKCGVHSDQELIDLLEAPENRA